MPRRRPPALTAIAAAAALCLLAAGCGSSSNSPRLSNASISSSPGGQPSHAQQEQDGIEFSRCMRSHGVASFPDPGGGSFKIALSPSTAHAPAFQSAYTACRHLLPGDGVPPNHSEARTPKQIAGFLAFAHCMRGRGLRGFPDPTSRGQITHEMLAKAGIDIHQPAVVQTADVCTGVTHGVVTKADVARFVAGR